MARLDFFFSSVRVRLCVRCLFFKYLHGVVCLRRVYIFLLSFRFVLFVFFLFFFFIRFSVFFTPFGGHSLSTKFRQDQPTSQARTARRSSPAQSTNQPSRVKSFIVQRKSDWALSLSKFLLSSVLLSLHSLPFLRPLFHPPGFRVTTWIFRAGQRIMHKSRGSFRPWKSLEF